MTALYAILAIICIGGILMGVYLIGFGDGVTAERMRRSLYVVERTVTLDDERRHSLTRADIVQLETETINKKEQDQQ